MTAITEATQKRICKLNQQGLTREQIAEATGVSRTSVYRVLRNQPAPSRKANLPVDELRQLKAEGWTHEQLGKRYGVSTTTIYSYLHGHVSPDTSTRHCGQCGGCLSKDSRCVKCHGQHMPTPQEIEADMAAIRAGWSEAEKAKRGAWMAAVPAETPEVSAVMEGARGLERTL